MVVKILIYLHFIEPKKVVVPVTREAAIVREEFDVVVRTETGYYIIGSDVTVSKSHARIYQDGGKYFIQDLGSLNGTKINGRYISGWRPRTMTSPAELEVGMVVEIGIKTMFRVELIEVETLENSKKRDYCSALLLLDKYVADAVITLLTVGNREESVNKLSQHLEFITSKNIFEEILENVYRNSTNTIKNHLNIIRKNPYLYLSSPEMLEGLRNILEGIRSNVNREHELCRTLKQQ